MKVVNFTDFMNDSRKILQGKNVLAKKMELLPVTADRFLAMVNEEILYRIDIFLDEHGVEPNAGDLQEIRASAVEFIEIRLDDGHR